MAGIDWPTLTWETLPWRPADPSVYSARQREKLPRSYTPAVVPPIASTRFDLPTELAALEAAATAAVARFDATAAASLLPFTALLLRSESSASSRIERLTCSARRIVEEELFGIGRGNAALVVANARAMATAARTPWPPDLEGLLSIHRALMGDTDPGIAGVVRTELVWIGGSDLSPGDALFVPPHHRRVPAALDDLLEFLGRRDLPTLTKAALAHAQFETIHPFADGNGRTGRALVHVVLAGENLTLNAPLPLSAILLADVEAYFAALDDYRQGQPLPIIRLFCAAAHRAAALGTEAVRELATLVEDLLGRVKARVGTVDRDLVRLLASQPVMDVRGASQALEVSEQTARRALERLESAGVVVGYQVSRGRRAWRSPDVLDLLDKVAVGTGLRQTPAGMPADPDHHTPRYSPTSSRTGAVPWTSQRPSQVTHSG